MYERHPPVVICMIVDVKTYPIITVKIEYILIDRPKVVTVDTIESITTRDDAYVPQKIEPKR